MTKHLVPLGEIVNFVGGGTPSRDNEAFWNGDIPWASVKDFKGLSIDGTAESITGEGLSNSSSTLVLAGHVIIPTRMALGKAAINSIDIAINQDLKALRPKGSISVRYLMHALLAKSREIQSLGKGATVQGITIERLNEIQIPLPPLEEQRRIAAILDAVHKLRKDFESALALEQEFIASLFDSYIGDPVLNPKGFPRKTLLELCSSSDDIKCGPFGTQLKQHEFREEGIPLWGIKHVNKKFLLPTTEFVDEPTAIRLSVYTLKTGDIVMTRKGTVGNCSVYPDSLPDGIMHSDLLRIRLNPSECLPEFAAYQLHHSMDVKRQIDLISGGAIMAGINVGKLKSIEVVVPGIDTQQEFASLASRASSTLWSNYHRSIANLRELSASSSTLLLANLELKV